MILYKKDVRGGVRVYEIFPFEEGYMVVWGHLGGVTQQKYTEVEENMSGRPHSMQVKLEINSKVSKMLDQGYKHRLEDAMQAQGLNSLGFIRPMLARPYKDQDINHMWTQYKYDGHRCLIHNRGGELLAYSRRAKEITTIGHILDGLEIPEGATVDGELYIHGVPLQTLSSYIKKDQDMSKELRYIMYDIDRPCGYADRHNELLSIKCGNYVEVAPTWNSVSLTKDLDGAIADGYEGLILRGGGDVGYEPGKRSKSLIKVKKWLDANFMIVGVDESVDGAAIFQFDNFSATAPGTMEEKIAIAEDYKNYIGRYARVEYAKLTKDGVPFHPVVTDIVDL